MKSPQLHSWKIIIFPIDSQFESERSFWQVRWFLKVDAKIFANSSTIEMIGLVKVFVFILSIFEAKLVTANDVVRMTAHQLEDLWDLIHKLLESSVMALFL